MWCSTCQQDVPGVASPDDPGQLSCPRCVGNLSVDVPETPDFRELPFSLDPPPLSCAGCEDDDDLLAAQRLVAAMRAQTSIRVDAAKEHLGRTDVSVIEGAAKDDARAAQPIHSRVRPNRRPPSAPVRKTRLNAVSWLLLSGGLMSFVFGAVLLICAWSLSRPELWTLGLPIAMVGQSGLLIGLVLQIDGLWRTNRRASVSLDELDGEVRELRHAATMLTTTHSSPASSFYAHFAEGASPHLLVADLKGQLDLLTQKMGD